MREQESSQLQASTLRNHDVEETAKNGSQRALDAAGAETKLRPMRTICLSECVIPE